MRLSAPRKLSSILLSGFLASTSLPSLAAEDLQDKRVLVISGYTDLGPWEQNFNNILLKELSTGYGMPVTPVFLPLLDTAGEEHRLIAESLRQLYSSNSGLNYDIIIGLQPAASAFLYRWGDLIAPDVARLYVLPSNELGNEILQSDTARVIKTATPFAIENTIRIMEQLLPELERVFVVGGNSAGDQSYLSRIANALQTLKPDIDTVKLAGLAPESIIEELSGNVAKSAILIGTYDRDLQGNAYRTIDITSLLSEQLAYPIFTIFEDLVGTGALGGNVTTSTSYAEQTVELTVSMLSGSPAVDLKSLPTVYKFDSDQLQRYGLALNLLPDDSQLINYDAPAWREYIYEISAAASVILVLLILLIALARSSRKRLAVEKELRESHKLEALGIFSSGIAHDFNNILMAIDGNAELAKLSLQKGPEKTSNYLSKISRASGRAKNLVQQVLLFSRSSQQEQHEAIDFRQLLEETCSMVSASCPDSIVINTSIANKLWPINANEEKIQQVIMNLCSNARQAIESDGKISISARNQKFRKPVKLTGGTMPPGEYVSVSISDSGSGISESIISRIFEPFFTTKTLAQGTGLGLSIVYGIIKEHKGFLNLESTPGKGTEFTIYFVSSDAQLEAPERNTLKTIGSKTIASGNGELVLLVDDDEMLIDVNENTILSLGYTVESYTSSVEALHQFKLNPDKFDLVFTDLSMSEMDGIRLISSIRAVRPDIPAILCTGYKGAFDLLSPEESSDVSLLYKPSSTEEISKTISELLAGSVNR